MQFEMQHDSDSAFAEDVHKRPQLLRLPAMSTHNISNYSKALHYPTVQSRYQLLSNTCASEPVKEEKKKD